MAKSKATATWNGTLKEGSGMMKYGQVEGPFTFASRFEEGEGTNPEDHKKGKEKSTIVIVLVGG